MVVIKLIIVNVLLLFMNSVVSGSFVVPDVTIEALQSGGFRAYIPDTDGVKLFAFHSTINGEIKMQDPGDYYLEVPEKVGDFWIASFPKVQLKVGDRIYYWIFCHWNRLGFGRDGLNTTITELLNEYPSLKSRCIKATSITNGRETCAGEVILDEQFSESTIDDSKWIVEQWIPTYSAPSFYFNFYINRDETRFISNGILYLKPVPVQTDADVRGVLDLRNGCTSKVESECYLRARSWSILPPVQSAKITSKVSFRYGKVDIKAKFPAGEWIVPVVRLEQKIKEDAESSPVVWIAYSRGNEHLYANGQDYGAHVFFAGPVLYQTEPERSQHLTSKRSPNPFYKEFHIYSLEWKQGKMTFSIDNTEYGSVDLTKSLGTDIDIRSKWNDPESPYNKEYVLSLGVAVGGLSDFPDGFTSGSNTKPWSNTEPKFTKAFFDQRAVWSSSWISDSAALQVDYVKITAI